VCFASTAEAEARLPERNLAVGKPVKLSTTYLKRTSADKAVDGDFLAGFSCTKPKPYSWLALDLAGRFLIREVIITTDKNQRMCNLPFYAFHGRRKGGAKKFGQKYFSGNYHVKCG